MRTEQKSITANKEYFFTLGYMWAYLAYRVGLKKWVHLTTFKAKWRKETYRQGANQGWQIANRFSDKVKIEALRVVLPKDADDLDDLRKKVMSELFAIYEKFPTGFVPSRNN